MRFPDTRAQGAVLDTAQKLGYVCLPVKNLPGPWDIEPCPACGKGLAFVALDGTLTCDGGACS